MRDVDNSLVERVIAERKRHAWSVRRAAAEGRISNTTWGEFEKTGRVTDTVQLGVAQAFGWATDWPDAPATAPDPADGSLVAFAAAALAARNNALLDTLNEKMDRAVDLLLELRDRPQSAHPSEQAFDSAP